MTERRLEHEEPRTCTTNHDAFVRAAAAIPGGVSSPVRAYGSVGGTPGSWQRARALRHRRRGARVRRPGRVLGAGDPRSCAPRGGRRRAGGGGTRAVVRCTDARRGRARRGDRPPRPVRRAAAARVDRHRGDHDGGSPGPGGHRSRPHREVRRLLPRPRRRTAGSGRVGGGERGTARLGRGHRGDRRRDPRPALQRPRRRAGGVRSTRRPDRGRDHRGAAGEHGRRALAAGLRPRAAPDHRRARCAADLRRGAHRVPGRPRRWWGLEVAGARAGGRRAPAGRPWAGARPTTRARAHAGPGRRTS